MSMRPISSLTTSLCLTTLFACGSTAPHFRRSVAEWEELHNTAPLPQATGLPADPRLADLVRFARANSPALAAAFEDWKRALQRIPQVSDLPSPRIQVGAFMQEIETRVGPMQGRLGLTLPLGRMGELDAAGEAALMRANVWRCEVERQRLEVDAGVRDVWHELVWLQRAIEISAGHRELLLHWESVALARLETGLGSHSDLLRAQIELGKIEDRVETLSDLRLPLLTRLNAALGAKWRRPLDLSPRPIPEARSLPEEELLSELPSTSPELCALAARIDAARSGIQLARKRSNPEVFVGAEYTLIGSARQDGVAGSGDDAIALTVGIDLPFWRGSNEAAVQEGQADMRAARHRHRDRLNQLTAELQMTLYTYRDADRRARLFHDNLIPKGEESLHALESAYETGERGFLDLIDAQRVLLEFQLEAIRAEIDRAQARVELERISGRQLHEEDEE